MSWTSLMVVIFNDVIAVVVTVSCCMKKSYCSPYLQILLYRKTRLPQRFRGTTTSPWERTGIITACLTSTLGKWYRLFMIRTMSRFTLTQSALQVTGAIMKEMDIPHYRNTCL